MTILTQTKSELDSTTIGFGISSVIVIIFNTILTIIKESYPPFLTFMKSISILGIKHHWLVHGIIVVVLFVLFGWFFSRKENFAVISGASLSKTIVWATILSSLGIIAFFLVEFFT